MSMAAVAMAHGVSANLLRRWVRDAEMNSATTVVSATTAETPKAQEAKTVFVPVSSSRRRVSRLESLMVSSCE